MNGKLHILSRKVQKTRKEAAFSSHMMDVIAVEVDGKEFEVPFADIDHTHVSDYFDADVIYHFDGKVHVEADLEHRDEVFCFTVDEHGNWLNGTFTDIKSRDVPGTLIWTSENAYVEQLIDRERFGEVLDEVENEVLLDIAVGEKPDRHIVDHRHHFVVRRIAEYGYVVKYEDGNSVDRIFEEDISDVPVVSEGVEWLYPAVEFHAEKGKEFDGLLDVTVGNEEWKKIADEIESDLSDML